MIEETEKTQKMSKEVAVAEFARFACRWDIDDDTGDMSQEDKDSFVQQRDRIVRQILKGNATVDDQGDKINYTLQHPKGAVVEIAFKMPKGSAYVSMDAHKERQSMHKLCSFMGEMTGQAPVFFSNMDARDMKFCMGVAMLFLGS